MANDDIRTIEADGAPAAIGPYAHAVEAAGWLFLSGQIPLDPSTGALVGEDAAEQTRQVMENLSAVLAAAGVGLDAVVKTTIYVVDLADFGAVNEVYASFLGGHRPARATVQVAALPKGARVEIDAIAVDRNTRAVE